MKKKYYIINYILYTILQLTWGIIQNVLGIFLFILLTIIKANRKRFYYHGSIVSRWRFGFSMGLGMFIFLGTRISAERKEEEVIVHEFGHTIQSIILGPLFMLVIAIPSTVWAFTPAFKRLRKERNIPYVWFFCEAWANYEGERVLKLPTPKL